MCSKSRQVDGDTKSSSCIIFKFPAHSIYCIFCHVKHQISLITCRLFFRLSISCFHVFLMALWKISLLVLLSSQIMVGKPALQQCSQCFLASPWSPSCFSLLKGREMFVAISCSWNTELVLLYMWTSRNLVFLLLPCTLLEFSFSCIPLWDVLCVL